MIITLNIPAIPVSQPRPRAVRMGKSARVHSVTHIKNARTGKRKPHPITAFKEAVRLAGRQAWNGPLLKCALRVDIVFVFPRERSKFWKTKPTPRYLHCVKPDRDNCDKALMDALSGIVWVDDAQVCDGRIQKFRASGDEQPHVEVTITTLE